MPRVFTQKKSIRGNEVKCGKCGVKIEPGNSYRKWTKRVGFGRVSGVTYYRCMKNVCSPSGSDLLSGRQAEFAEISEAFDAINRQDAPADIAAACEEIKGQVEAFREDMQSGFDNMPEGLQQGETGQLIETRVQEMEEIESALDDAIGTLEQLQEDIDGLQQERQEKLAELSAMGVIYESDEIVDDEEDDHEKKQELRDRIEEIDSELDEKESESESALDEVSWDMS